MKILFWLVVVFLISFELAHSYDSDDDRPVKRPKTRALEPTPVPKAKVFTEQVHIDELVKNRMNYLADLRRRRGINAQLWYIGRRLDSLAQDGKNTDGISKLIIELIGSIEGEGRRQYEEVLNDVAHRLVQLEQIHP